MYKNLLINYYKNKPKSEIQDFIKLIYQGTFGGEHLVKNKETVFNYLLTECNQIEISNKYEPLYEIISDEYVRINLVPYIKGNFSLKELNDCFCEQKANRSLNTLIERINIFLDLVSDNTIKLNKEETTSFLEEYRKNNFPVFHHTIEYRNEYNPHYRVVPIDFLSNEMKEYQLLSFIKNIEATSKQKHVYIAVEGKCASGKTTLIDKINKSTNITIVHTDDFFLSKKEKEIPIGDFINYSKIIDLLKALENNEFVTYEKFNCSKQLYEKATIHSTSKIIILEGVYSFNLHLREYMNNLIFVTINKEDQLKRLQKRENSESYQKFIDLWIPNEEKYYSTFPILDMADLLI